MATSSTTRHGLRRILQHEHLNNQEHDLGMQSDAVCPVYPSLAQTKRITAAWPREKEPTREKRSSTPTSRTLITDGKGTSSPWGKSDPQRRIPLHPGTTIVTRTPPGLAPFPPAQLHVWVYQARQLAFRRMFASMYERHGLHLRLYFVIGKVSVGGILESRRNFSGNMANPIWRKPRDVLKDQRRGHFDVTINAAMDPKTELVIEIVCGILVVANAKVPVRELVATCLNETNAQPVEPKGLPNTEMRFGKGANMGGEPHASNNRTDATFTSDPHWIALQGADNGMIEISLELCLDNVQDACPTEDPKQGSNNPAEPEDFGASHLGGFSRGNQSTSVIQRDVLEDAARLYRHEEARHQTRRQRFENLEVGDNPRMPSIPERAKARLAQRRASTPVTTSRQPDGSVGAKTLSQQQQLDKQLWDLYFFGISNARDTSGSNASSVHPIMTRTSSTMSQASQYSMTLSDYSERSEASIYGRKASTCASDVLAYNELIQDIEASIECNRAAEQSSETAFDGSICSDLSISTSDQQPLETAFVEVGGLAGEATPLPDQPKSRQRWLREKSRSLNEKDRTSGPQSRPESANTLTESDNHVAKGGSSTLQQYLARGRRRSLPLSRLTSTTGDDNQDSPVSSNFAAISEVSRDSQGQSGVEARQSLESERTPLRRQRSASLHSLNDLWRQEMRLEELEATLRHLEACAGAARRKNDHASHSEEYGREVESGESAHGQAPASAPQSRTTPKASESAKFPTLRRNSSGNNVVTLSNGVVLAVGKFIKVGNVPGVIRYVGPTQFASDIWIGIELCERKGKNNGTVKGVEYFKCAPDHGIFIRANRVDVSVE